MLDVARREQGNVVGDPNFRIRASVTGSSTYFVIVGAALLGEDGNYSATTGDYAIHAEFTPN